jgi:hypothetical protein
VASGNTVVPNDSAYSFRYDDNFIPTALAILAEDFPRLAFNDMALICHEKGRFVAFSDFEVGGATIYTLDDDGGIEREDRISQTPLPEGGSFLEDPLRGDLALITATLTKDGLLVNWLGWDLVFKESRRILEVDLEESQSYWPQGVLVIEDRIVVAYVQQPANENMLSDWGNIWLAFYNLEWQLLENHQITQDTGPDGTMRPGLALQGDTLFLTYDEIEEHPPGIVQPRIIPITLNLEAFSDFVDTGSADTAGGNDTGSGVAPSPSLCGCVSGPGSGSSVVPGFLCLLGIMGLRSGRKRERST